MCRTYSRVFISLGSSQSQPSCLPVVSHEYRPDCYLLIGASEVRVFTEEGRGGRGRFFASSGGCSDLGCGGCLAALQLTP